MRVIASDGAMRVIASDGAMRVIASDGAMRVIASDGAMRCKLDGFAKSSYHLPRGPARCTERLSVPAENWGDCGQHWPKIFSHRSVVSRPQSALFIPLACSEMSAEAIQAKEFAGRPKDTAVLPVLRAALAELNKRR